MPCERSQKWGLIPAHAGKTFVQASKSSVVSGSSPLTRGKLSGWTPRRRPRRLIPAHAGKTPGSRRCLVCEVGSSPLTRGKHDVVQLPVLTGRLIPAHAGKTPFPLGRRRCGRAHPRSRGENVHSIGEDRLHAGSSPLTRGKQNGRPGALQPGGLIPAHAGKTMFLSPVRGSGGGSSPLTRGKPQRPRYESSDRGLIPAHAGKT